MCGACLFNVSSRAQRTVNAAAKLFPVAAIDTAGPRSPVLAHRRCRSLSPSTVRRLLCGSALRDRHQRFASSHKMARRRPLVSARRVSSCAPSARAANSLLLLPLPPAAERCASRRGVDHLCVCGSPSSSSRNGFPDATPRPAHKRYSRCRSPTRRQSHQRQPLRTARAAETRRSPPLDAPYTVAERSTVPCSSLSQNSRAQPDPQQQTGSQSERKKRSV